MTTVAPPADFERPERLQAAAPAERRGRARDEVRLLVSCGLRHEHRTFLDLPRLLEPGDLLVVNRSATLPASLPASGHAGSFLMNLSTRYGPHLWLAEPRWSHARPGPVPLASGASIEVAGVPGRVVGPHPRLQRLTFVAFAAPLEDAMRRRGRPIRYAYVTDERPLEDYQTIFADVPGSAEMPSAARPFTRRTLDQLAARGVSITRITLHTGVSSLPSDADGDAIELYAEPFEVPPAAAAAIMETRARGGRVIAVGTTVVRALESAWDGERLAAARGFTRRVVRPGAFHGSVDGLLTGLHDADSSHLAMLYAVGGRAAVLEAYRAAVDEAYLWHEFGDVHLLWGANVAERSGEDVRGGDAVGGEASGEHASREVAPGDVWVRRGSARAP